MNRNIKIFLILLSAAALVIVCARSPIGDRILAKACILGVSKIGECQLAK